MTSGDLIIDLRKKSTDTFVVISDELSNALFGFSLRRLEAELQGREAPPPPPHQVVENPETRQGAN